jgi:hypothetical protein
VKEAPVVQKEDAVFSQSELDSLLGEEVFKPIERLDLLSTAEFFIDNLASIADSLFNQDGELTGRDSLTELFRNLEKKILSQSFFLPVLEPFDRSWSFS